MHYPRQPQQLDASATVTVSDREHHGQAGIPSHGDLLAHEVHLIIANLQYSYV